MHTAACSEKERSNYSMVEVLCIVEGAVDKQVGAVMCIAEEAAGTYCKSVVAVKGNCTSAMLSSEPCTHLQEQVVSQC